jgi:hypothetical protein
MDEEDDDGFFVPHGHLSDDELDDDEREVNNKSQTQNLFKLNLKL